MRWVSGLITFLVLLFMLLILLAGFLIGSLVFPSKVHASDSVLPTGASQEFVGRALDFEKHWNLFIRRLGGCPDVGDTTQETCSKVRAKLDYKEFDESRKAAQKLFDLEDKEK